MGKLKESNPSGTIDTHNVLATGSILEGDISSEKDFRIDGTINGNIACHGRIIIGPTGLATGNIECKNIEIQGSIKGNIKCYDTTTLRASAKIQGDILTTTVEIEPHAEFSGHCTMLTEENEQKNDKDNKRKN